MTLFFVNVTVRVFEMYKKKFCAISGRHQRRSVDEIKIPDVGIIHCPIAGLPH